MHWQDRDPTGHGGGRSGAGSVVDVLVVDVVGSAVPAVDVDVLAVEVDVDVPGASVVDAAGGGQAESTRRTTEARVFTRGGYSSRQRQAELLNDGLDRC